LKDTIDSQQKEKDDSEKLLKESSEEFDRIQAEKNALEEHVKEKEKEIDMSRLEKLKNRIMDMRIKLRKLQKEVISPEGQSETKRQEMLVDIERAKVEHVHAKYGIPLPIEPPLPEESLISIVENEPLLSTTTSTAETISTTTEPDSGMSLLDSLLAESPDPPVATDTPTSEPEIPSEPASPEPEIPQIDEKEKKRKILQEKQSEVSNLEAEISGLNELIDSAMEHDDYEKCAELDEQLSAKKSQIESLQDAIQKLKQDIGDEQ